MEKLIARLYESALETDRMDPFLEQYAEHLRADSGAVLVCADLRKGTGSIIGSARTDHSYSQKYEDYYGKINVYLDRLKRLRCLGDVRPGEALVPEEELVRTEYYNDYMKPQNVHYSLGVAFHFVEGFHIHLGAVRSRRAGGFGPAEREIAEALAPHVGQAVRLRARLARERCRVQALEEVADALPFGVLHLDAKGKVLEANRRGAEILRASDGLKTVDGRLEADTWVDSRALSLLIGSAAKPAAGVKPGGAARISRPSGARPYVVNVFPLNPARLPGSGPECPAVILLISDPSGMPADAAGRLREVFGLTPAEASVCLLLGAGEELAVAAGRLGISANTARTHLKHIFLKTETSRQSELVRILNDAFRFRLVEPFR